jgi:MbtH protein
MDAQLYQVIISEEERYSLWPAEQPLPAGWRALGFQGLEKDCMRHIDAVLNDLRPTSLRKAMLAIEADALKRQT